MPDPQTTTATAHAMTLATSGTSAPGLVVTQGTAHAMTIGVAAGVPATGAHDADAIPTKACFPNGLRRPGPLVGTGAGFEHGDYRDSVVLRKNGNYSGDLSLACSHIADTSISGYGFISSVVVYVASRIITNGGTGTISAAYFTLPGRTAAMTTNPPIGASGIEYAECASANLTTHDGAHAWTWGNIFAALAGLTATVTVDFTGTYIEAQVAMFRAEVFGPLGAPRRKLFFEYAIAPIRRTLTSRLIL